MKPPFRWFALFLLALLPSLQAAETRDLIASVENVTVKEGRQPGTTAWFHPRGCLLPDGTVFWTLQSIGGSDVFGPVQWMTTRDLGAHWTEPAPVPGFGRTPAADGLEEGVCDVVPEYHAKTGTILAIGHNVFYKNNALAKPQPARWPVYVVRDAAGKWSEKQRLVWEDPRGSYIYSCNCAQRINLPDGDVLIPLTYGPTENKRSVGTVRCGFDGKTLAVKKTSNELKGNVGRGLLEPSLAVFGGKYYMTIRAEDGHGYVTVSNDGLSWAPQQAWKFDDGEEIAMSTTQQRWLTHSAALYLVYTRKSAENAAVFRWRTPLYAARVDPATLRLIKATERVVVPMTFEGKNAAQLGNFHTQAVSANESWVTVGEVIVPSFRGNLLLARIKWAVANAGR